jgi:hypothetical protein
MPEGLDKAGLGLDIAPAAGIPEAALADRQAIEPDSLAVVAELL